MCYASALLMGVQCTMSHAPGAMPADSQALSIRPLTVLTIMEPAIITMSCHLC